jgi:uncharacterized UPF0146 family protein
MPTNITSFVMFCGVFGSCHNLKIFNPVIKFVSVDMVDYFVGVKRTANLFFHDKAVKVDILAVVADCFVSMDINIYRMIRSMYSMQTAIFMKSLIMLGAETFAISLVITSFYFASIGEFVVRACRMNIAMSILSRIMLTAKIHSKNGIIAILNFTYKLFHISNINQFDKFVKQNTGG